MAAAHADVAHLAGLNEVVERLHRLLRWRVRVEAVDLIEVDEGRVEPRERVLDGVENGRAGKAHPVGILLALAHDRGMPMSEDVVVRTLPNEGKALGEDDDLFPRDLILQFLMYENLNGYEDVEDMPSL